MSYISCRHGSIYFASCCKKSNNVNLFGSGPTCSGDGVVMCEDVTFLTAYHATYNYMQFGIGLCIGVGIGFGIGFDKLNHR